MESILYQTSEYQVNNKLSLTFLTVAFNCKEPVLTPQKGKSLL